MHQIRESTTSIFGNIMGAIFGHHGTSASTSAAPSSSVRSTPSGSPTSQPAPGTAAQTSTGQPVDVEAVLRERAAKKGEPLDWRHSIVDLMKALDLDSSLAARKQLAQELHYTGALD